MNRRGFVMILALVYALVLTVIVMAMAYFIASETRGVGFQLDDAKALYLAQAGIERGLREIRDEVITPLQTGTADLRGATTTGSTNVTYVERIRYIGESNGLARFTTGTAFLADFDSNYTSTRGRVISVQAAVRASRASIGGGATIQVAYATDGSTYNTVITQALTTSVSNYFANIPVPAWSDMMSSDFKLRCLRSAGRSRVNLDALFLRVTYAIDTNTEPWYTGTYDAFPMALGDGTIKTVAITDEARKVHLNTASQALLSYLMREHNIPASTADTIATNIVNYRGASLTNPFDSVEELQRVTAMTSEYYNLIKDDVTVYSFINTSCQRPIDAPLYRAPVNINTASREVLEAIFDPIIGTSRSASLASDIVTRREIAPFTCFYNSDAAVTTDLYDFINERSYLTTTQRNRTLDNADASLLVPVKGYAGYNAATTEFCYASTTYCIESVGSISVPGAVTSDIDLRAVSIAGNDATRVFAVYANQPQSGWKGYWRENYE